MVRITWQDLMKNPPIQAGGEEYKEKTAGLGIEKTGCSGKSDRYPHFPKFSRFGVDNYFFKFSILHNHQLDFPHPVKSNVQGITTLRRFCYSIRDAGGRLAWASSQWPNCWDIQSPVRPAGSYTRIWESHFFLYPP